MGAGRERSRRRDGGERGRVGRARERGRRKFTKTNVFPFSFHCFCLRIISGTMKRNIRLGMVAKNGKVTTRRERERKRKSEGGGQRAVERKVKKTSSSLGCRFSSGRKPSTTMELPFYQSAPVATLLNAGINNKFSRKVPPRRDSLPPSPFPFPRLRISRFSSSCSGSRRRPRDATRRMNPK